MKPRPGNGLRKPRNDDRRFGTYSSASGAIPLSSSRTNSSSLSCYLRSR
jgi:hypothetical protein